MNHKVINPESARNNTMKEKPLTITKNKTLSSSRETITPASKDYDKFFKDKIKKSPEKEEKNASSSLTLIIILIVILIITIVSGFYYYFFVLSKTPIPVKPPITIEPDLNFPVEPLAEKAFPFVLTNSPEIVLTTKNDIKVILFDPQNPENLTSNFYSIKNEGGMAMNIKELSLLLGIQIPEIINATPENTWIYYNSSATPEISLVIGIDIEDAVEIKQSILKMENELPKMMSGLYSTPIIEYLIEKTLLFKDSSDDQAFRYYNFATTPSDLKSLDWGIINNDTILVFATSKEMASTISNQLLINDIPNNTTKEVILENTPEDVTPGDILENEAVVD